MMHPLVPDFFLYKAPTGKHEIPDVNVDFLASPNGNSFSPSLPKF